MCFIIKFEYEKALAKYNLSFFQKNFCQPHVMTII